MDLILTLFVGFSVIAAAVLYTAYAGFLNNLSKSPRALLTGALLLIGLSAMQLAHLEHFQSGTEPLGSIAYRFWLFLTPPMFYLFGRAILFDEQRFAPTALIHLAPVLLIFVARIEISISILFCIGTGYSLWLTHLIYRLRRTRQRAGFELFFLALFTIMAIGVLLLGFSLPYMQSSYFYAFYAFSIGLALALVNGALLCFPELLSELAEAARLSYAKSTLNDIDVGAKKRLLNALMEDDKIFQQEDLNLAALAAAVDLGAHQLSELINTEYAMSFSRFVRDHRVREAQRLLKAEPEASILSISMAVGFRSQSNFYAAFKEHTGRSPGAFRSNTGQQKGSSTPQ
ncbi:MAG: helix-turn-helix domain-containing protein [Pseudomonadota bacterium]